MPKLTSAQLAAHVLITTDDKLAAAEQCRSNQPQQQILQQTLH